MTGRAFSSSKSAIIALLLEAGELSRSEIATRTGLSRAAISLAMTELIDAGFVQETGTSKSTGGRKPVLVRLGGESRLVVGAALEDRSCSFMLVNLDGRVLDTLEIPVVVTGDPHYVVQVVAEGIATLFANRSRKALFAVGLSLSGQINSLTDTFSSSPWRLKDVPLGNLLETDLGVPSLVLDNAHAAGLGELWQRGREHRRNLVYFYLGKGAGGAIITDRTLYTGANHAAGEIGAIILDPNGPDFGCHRGCLEGFVSYSNLRGIIAARLADGSATTLPDDLDDDVFIDALATAAAAGDAVALSTMEYAALYIGLQTANTINLLNPDEIIIGGPFGRLGTRFAEMVAAQAARTALPALFASVTIMPGSLVTRSAPLGVAAAILMRAPELLVPTASVRALLHPR